MSVVEQNARTVEGRVVSDAGDKTIVVLVERKIRHPKYGKYIKRSSKMHAHDEQNQAKTGDIVRIKESRPHSKQKTWELEQVLSNQE